VGVEVWIVLGLSLGRSAVYALVELLNRLTWTPPIAEQTTAALNSSASDRPWWDLLYQLLSIGFGLVPVVLALYLLGGSPRAVLARIGLNLARPGRDLAWSLALAAAIGVPGLGVYALGRVAGINLSVMVSDLGAHWWTVPVLILAALKNGLAEEVVVVAYLVTRLEQLRWRPWAVLAATALLRGGYHLYQGFGMFLGNAVMGLVFAQFYRRTRRVAPLVAAHALIDIVSFVGPSFIPIDWLP
jgi:membrane protease YdiL (CAAX protease family)